MPTSAERAIAFVEAVAARAPVETILAFYHPDVVHEELPNRLLPNGATRNLAELREASEKGRKVISKETYEIVSVTEEGQRVVLEAIWTGTLAVGFGSLAPGDVMRARFAQVFELEDGLIRRQRNYDCFEPW